MSNFPKNSSPSRVRSWSFTINNYTESELHKISAHSGGTCVREIGWQEEIGENGTPHLQGFVVFHNGKTLSSVKKMEGFERSHLEVAKNLQALRNYCKKSDTAIEGTQVHITNLNPVDMIYNEFREIHGSDKADVFNVSALLDQLTRAGKWQPPTRKERAIEFRDLMICKINNYYMTHFLTRDEFAQYLRRDWDQ